MNLIRTWFKSLLGFFVAQPAYDISHNEDTQRRAGLIYAVVWPSMAITVGLGIMLLLAGAPWLVMVTVGLMFLVMAITVVWMRRGNINTAARVFVFAGWAVTAAPAFLQDGLSSPYLLFSIVMVLLASLLLERRYVQIITILSVLVATILLITSNYPILPQVISSSSPVRRWAALLAAMLAISVIVQLAMENLRAALESARQNQQRLSEANRMLEETQAVLERRVTERTEALEQRAQRLQIASEIAGTLASIRSLNQLLNEAAHLLADRFGYYHVGIYMAEADETLLRLASANTQAGKTLIEQGFQLQLAQTSLATSAARSRQTRVVADVRTDDQFMTLEELNLTRSEICLPLLAGEKLLGVLDLQDTQVRAPASEELSTLRILSSQIAAAIDNVQLFAANQRSLESLQRAYGTLSSEGWQKALRARPDLGYRVGAGGTPAPADGDWPADMASARRDARVILADPYTLAVPIKIREQSVGVIRLRKPEETGPWVDDEVSLAQTLSDRLSAALESARLYEETRRRAERERLTGEITARIRASNDPQTILETAAHELRKALQADRAQLIVQAAVEESPHDAG